MVANKIVQNLLGLGGLSLCIQQTVDVVNHGDAPDISRIELRPKLDRQIYQFKLFRVETLIDDGENGHSLGIVFASLEEQFESNLQGGSDFFDVSLLGLSQNGSASLGSQQIVGGIKLSLRGVEKKIDALFSPETF